VTGGLGGVHRGAERTYETLETLGVPVLAFGTDDFPAFYSPISGHPSPMMLDDLSDLIALIAATWRLGLTAGIAIVNPIPAEDEIGSIRRGFLDRRTQCQMSGIDSLRVATNSVSASSIS